MSPATRLAGFTAVLALVFAGAAFAGSRIDVHPGRPSATEAAKPAMGEMRAGAKMAPQAVRGLAVSDNGLTLRLARTTATPGRAVRSSPSASSTAAGGPCATSTSSTPSACTSSSCGAT